MTAKLMFGSVCFEPISKSALYQGTTSQAAENSLNEGHGFSRAVKSHSYEGFRGSVRTQPAGVSFVTEIIRNWTGAPGSPKRTWAEKDIFECFQLDGSAAPNGFSWTDSLKRSWASPRISL
jgi:hypothetical protein